MVASIIAYSLDHDEVRPARLRPPRARDGSALQLGAPNDFPARPACGTATRRQISVLLILHSVRQVVITDQNQNLTAEQTTGSLKRKLEAQYNANALVMSLI
jgi:hypothetical protein